MATQQRGALSDLWLTYRLRWKRRRFLFRIWRKRRQIRASTDRTSEISNDAILLFSTMRNEMVRLPHFMDYYRALGVDHFLIVDNGSDDGTATYLADQPDVSVWHTDHSYKLARFGMDWLGWLQWQFANGHWCLTVDADELLVYPFSDTRNLTQLTAWLDAQKLPSFGATMLEMYPKGPVQQATYRPGDNPIETIPWFDAHNYRHQIHSIYGNLWIQGGVRERVFFGDSPVRAPTLSKTPLVRWQWRYAYVSSTHQILPRRLNHVFDLEGGSKTTGALLHTKFLPIVGEKSAEEITRCQHFENSDLYQDYHRRLTEDPDLWNANSCRYENTEQLIKLGLMSKGKWV